MTTTVMRAASIAYLIGEGAQGPAPVAVGQKFSSDGQVLAYPGNTFICHIPPGPAHRALTAAVQRLQDGLCAPAFAFLPPSSYHMTIFEGVTDKDRSDGRWPEGIDAASKVDAVTAAFLQVIGKLELPTAVTIRPTGLFGGFSVRVEGATMADQATLRRARESLREATGICRPNFDDYTFHITLAYLLRWLTQNEAETVMLLSDEVAEGLLADAPLIPLGGVEFCSFADMNVFPLIARLS
jgi:hypothetical protein